MLRHHDPVEASPNPLATSEELAEAVALLRRQKQEEQRRVAESEALVAALGELGESVTREELLEAVALVRARRAAQAVRPRNRWRRPALFIGGAAAVMVLPFLLIRLMIVPAPAPPAFATEVVRFPIVTDFDKDGPKGYWELQGGQPGSYDAEVHRRLRFSH